MADTDKKSIEDRDDVKLTFGEHLEELRTRVLYSFIAVVVCFFLCYAFKVQLLDLVRRPHDLTMKALGLDVKLNVIRYQEGFLTLLKISFIAGLVLASPVIVYQMWKFVWVGLVPKERRYVRIFAPISFLNFLIGVLFGYFFLIPIGLRFLLSVLGPNVQPRITMAEYVGFVSLLTLILGLVFELPLIMLFLSKIGIFTSEQYAQHRRPAILIAFILGAIFTPPDPFTQIMMAIPMIGLYEIGILVTGFNKRNLLNFCKGVAVVVLGIVALLLWGHYASPAKVIAVHGAVHVAGSPAKKGSPARGWILTEADGRIEFVMADKSTVKADSNTSLRVTGASTLQIKRGRIFVQQSSKDGDFVVRTPTGDVTAQGAAFQVAANDVETVVTVVSGHAEITYQGVRKPVLPGRRDRITRGGVVVDVDNELSWTKGWGAK